MPELSMRLRVALAFLAIYAIWGSTYLGIRLAIASIPPFVMAGIRFMIAGGIMLAWAAAKGIPRPTLANWKATAIVGGLLLFGGNGGVTWAEQTIPSSLAAVLITITPIWMVMVELFRKDHPIPNRQVILGLAMGLAGVVLLVGPSSLAGGASINLFGAAVVLLAALSWAVGSVSSGTLSLPKSPILGTGMEMVSGGVLLIITATLSGEWVGFDPSKVSTVSLLALVYLVVFGSIIALTSYVWLLTKTTIARVSTYAYVTPVVAILLGVAFAGEQFTSSTLLASAIIVVAVVVITTFK